MAKVAVRKSIMPNTYSALLARLPGTRYSTPILADEGILWEATPQGYNLLDPAAMINPHDASEVLMWYGGGAMLGGKIGLATASLADLRTWTRYAGNPIFEGGALGAWDVHSVRLDCVLYNSPTDEFWLYYTGFAYDSVSKIGLATSSDGINWTRYAGNPIFSATPPDLVVSNSAVLRADATHWYMYYCHRGDGGVLPNIKLATSSDGLTWLDTGLVVWPQGVDGTYNDVYMEWLSVNELSDKYVLMASCYDGSRWTLGIASCSTPNGTFTGELAPAFEPTDQAGTFDRYAVACGALTKINDNWYIIYQGQDDIPPGGDYGIAHWELGLAEL